MSTAFIDPQPDGTAVVEIDGITRRFTDFWAALAEARLPGRTCRVGRFPNPSPALVVELVPAAPVT